MEIPQILAIILFTMEFMAGVFFNGEYREIRFGWRTLSIIIWISILYFGGFWN